LFLNSRKYDPGFSFQIPDPVPGSRGKNAQKAPDHGSGSATLPARIHNRIRNITPRNIYFEIYIDELFSII
jgi:hypothetical protein